MIGICAIAFLTISAGGRLDTRADAAEDGGATVPGAYIQRTMRLLADSTPKHPNTVRVLFYGQSITEQDWWKQVETNLRKRFPSANLIVENRAIGGFAADLLGRIEPIDVPPFQPDLLILHDYGGEPAYEEMVRNIRRQTTAEVLLQSDHITSFPGPAASADERRGFEWHNAHVDWLKNLGKQIQCGVVDVRGAWREYLQNGNVDPRSLLRDGVHLNDPGMDLMAKVVTGFLVRDPRQPEGLPVDGVKTYRIGKDVRWREGKIVLHFEGNRVDLVPTDKAVPGKVTFLIDGKRPSEFAGCYTFTRPTIAHKAWFPALIGMRADAIPLIEEWTATLTNISPDGRTFGFSVKGSRTGEDGIGRSDQPFRSNSGRVVIDPKDWAVWYAKAVANETTPEGFEVKWQVQPMYQEVWKDQSPFTFAQGFPNGKHTLEIVTDEPGAIAGIRTYKPPMT